jgi:hypothetical protein
VRLARLVSTLARPFAGVAAPSTTQAQTAPAVGDAIGTGGVPEVFKEDELGGTTIRIRLIFGR